MLFPAFSKLNPKDDKETLKNVYQFSIRYASILVVPVAALVMTLAEPAVATLFGDTYGTAPLFLALLSITYFYTATGSLTTGNFIISQGKTKFIFHLTALTTAIGIPVGYILIMTFGVLGLIATTLIAGIPSLLISIFWIKKHYELTVDWRSSTKILFASAIAAIPTYVLVSQLEVSNWIRLVIGAGFFIIVYVFAALFTRTVTRADISNIRNMISGIGGLNRIISRLLDMIEKMIDVLRL
jgi:O-antigen/teichoic acid export membrane protein